MARFRSKARFVRDGAVLIEAAVSIFVFILLTFGAIEFGTYLFTVHMMTGAARNGARTAIVAGSTQTTVQTAVNNIMSAASFTSSQYTVETDDLTAGKTNVDPSTIPAGNDVAVHVKATWGTIGMNHGMVISAGRAMNCVVVMRKEG